MTCIQHVAKRHSWDFDQILKFSSWGKIWSWECFLSFTLRALQDRVTPICRQLSNSWKLKEFSYFLIIVNFALKGLPVTQDLTCTTSSGSRVHTQYMSLSLRVNCWLFLTSGLWKRCLTQILNNEQWHMVGRSIWSDPKNRKNRETALFKAWIVENVFCRK